MPKRRVCGFEECIELLEDLQMLGMKYKLESFPVYYDEKSKEVYYDVFHVDFEIMKESHVAYSEEEVELFMEALDRLGFDPKVITEGNRFVIEYGQLKEEEVDHLVPIIFED